MFINAFKMLVMYIFAPMNEINNIKKTQSTDSQSLTLIQALQLSKTQSISETEFTPINGKQFTKLMDGKTLIFAARLFSNYYRFFAITENNNICEIASNNDYIYRSDTDAVTHVSKVTPKYLHYWTTSAFNVNINLKINFSEIFVTNLEPKNDYRNSK